MVDFKRLPSVEITKVEHLPSISAIYFVICNETLLYVGKAVNLQTRWRSHHRYEQLVKSYTGCRVHWQTCPKFSLAKREAKYIMSLVPALNNKIRPITDRKQGNILVGSIESGDYDKDWLFVMARLSAMSIRAFVSDVIKESVRESKGYAQQQLAYTARKYGLTTDECFRQALINPKFPEGLTPVDGFEEPSPEITEED